MTSPQQAHAAPAAPVWAPQVFFDAELSTFDREGTLQAFEGNVVAIAAGTLIAADRIVLNRAAQTLTATGHVLVLNATQVFSGETMTHHLTTGEFTLTNAGMVANYPQASQNIIAKTLGFSFEDLAFEAARKEQLQALTERKEELRQAYRQRLQEPAARRALIEQYTVVLEKEQMMRAQKSPQFARLPLDKRQSFERRREYWQKSQTEGLQYSFGNIGYFAIQGDTIRRLDANQFQATNAFMTPCLCEEDEKPAWGFYSSEIVAKAEGYADLKNAVLSIKGVPLLYLPYLKIPIKAKRQSGFLLPNVTYTSANGNIISQPVYFALSDDSDATITTDFIAKRGFRLGAEYRLQAKRYSGWEVSGEAIRDRLWLSEVNQRDDLIERYGLGLAQARTALASGAEAGSGNSPSEPEWWQKQGLGFCLDGEDEASQCLTYNVKNRLSAPEGGWRGKFNWHGQSIIAPRLSLVSSGLMLSDHRYLDDLYVPNFSSPTASAAPALFAEANYRFHLDAQNFYAGLGSSYGDHALTARRFDGYQLPLTLRLQSRLVSLAPAAFAIPIYGQMVFDHKRISLQDHPQLEASLAPQVRLQSLAGGAWQRSQFTLLSPLIVDQAFQASHFTEFEQRFITTGRLYSSEHLPSATAHTWESAPHSLKNHLHTLRTGLRLSLPLEGNMLLRPGMNPSDGTPLERQLEHRMNWEMILSLRPYVARRGDYGEAYQLLKRDESTGALTPLPGTQRLTYFASDSKDYSDIDVVAEERLMVPHQKIIFKTNHSWLISSRKWQLQEGQMKAPDSATSPASQSASALRRQAERELFYSLDRPINSTADMVDEQSGQWYVNRYHLADVAREEPLSLDAEISYDYRKEKDRRYQRDLGESALTVGPLAEPWSPLKSNVGLKWQDWSLTVSSQYNLYQRNATELNFGLVPPSFFKTSLGIYYRIEKENTPLSQGGFLTTQTRTRTYTLGTELLPHTVWNMAYGIRTKYDRIPSQEYMAQASLKYLSPSDCWGLKFAWEKTYSDVTWDGTYFLALVVKFLNYDRDIGNLAGRFNKQAL